MPEPSRSVAVFDDIRLMRREANHRVTMDGVSPDLQRRENRLPRSLPLSLFLVFQCPALPKQSRAIGSQPASETATTPVSGNQSGSVRRVGDDLLFKKYFPKSLNMETVSRLHNMPPPSEQTVVSRFPTLLQVLHACIASFDISRAARRCFLHTFIGNDPGLSKVYSCQGRFGCHMPCSQNVSVYIELRDCAVHWASGLETSFPIMHPRTSRNCGNGLE